MPSTPPATKRSDTPRIVLFAAVAIGAIASFLANRWWDQYDRPHPVQPGDSEAGDCRLAGRSAYGYFVDHIGPFYSSPPPYDVKAWDSVESEIYSRISNAELKCICFEPPCTSVKGAMKDLRAVVAQINSAVRSGTHLSAGEGVSMTLDRVRQGL